MMNKRVCCLSRSVITLWCMLAMISLYAQRETYTYDLTFSTTNQCMWRTGTCGTGVVSYFLGLPFEHSGSGGGFFSVPLLGEFGIRGSASARGRIGLLFQAEATGGDVSVVYPIQISLSVPTREYLVQGGIVVVESSYRLNQGAQMTTRSPDAWASMSGVLDFQGSFSVRARAFSEDILNRSLNVPTLNYNQQLFHTSNINIWDRDFDLLSNYPGVLVLNLHYPRIATAAGNPSNPNATKLRAGPCGDSYGRLNRRHSLSCSDPTRFTSGYELAQSILLAERDIGRLYGGASASAHHPRLSAGF
ncbi:MAG: hypothetical protein SNJ72_11145 [Fimbriimonadales bacterium]